MPIWIVRISFLVLCALAGFAVSQLQPGLISHPYGVLGGFGLGGLLIAVDEMLKGFSLRAFSATTFGLVLGTIIAWLIDRSGLFDFVDERVRWLIRLVLFLGAGYIGIILAMRSNKEDFYLIIPYVRFRAQNTPENLLVLDTSSIIDGRIADLIELKFIEGIIVVPKFVLSELQAIADSEDAMRRERGRRGLDMLNRIRQSARHEVKVHEAEIPEEQEVDAKLIRLARLLGAKLCTNDFNLSKVAALQSVSCLNVNELATALKPVIVPGEILNIRIVREGRERGQGLAYLNDGTMVVVNHADDLIGRQVHVQVQSVRQTGAGVMIFADLRAAA